MKTPKLKNDSWELKDSVVGGYSDASEFDWSRVTFTWSKFTHDHEGQVS